jgi:signal transduction histidine kinase
MSPHAVAHAFDPFFSERSAGRRTGLGLAIARRFITLHGAEIHLKSQTEGAGRGTTATITLPRWRYARLTQQPPKPRDALAA